MDEKSYWLWFSFIDDMWSKKMQIFLDRFGSVEEIYKASRNSLVAFVNEYNNVLDDMNVCGLRTMSDINNKSNNIEEKRFIKGNKVEITLEDVERIFDKENGKRRMDDIIKKMERKRIRFTYAGDGSFPDKLYNLQSPVYVIFYIGKLPVGKTCSIIGARNCSEYGKKYALLVGENLALGNMEVISGMARGIDTYGMYGAFRNGGTVYAVLGSGVDICYPKENFELYESIKQRGGIISEYPPGCTPLSWHFPHRNRIISGLSDCVAVIEAKKKSGSLITVAYAHYEGKDVYALPGRVSDELSVGCNELIRDGAAVLFDGREIVFDITGRAINKRYSKAKLKKELGTDKLRIYEFLSLTPESVENVSINTGISADIIRTYLLEMEMSGYIIEVASGYYVRA